MTSPRRVNRGPKAAAGNRAALIQAAREVFAESGFDALIAEKLEDPDQRGARRAGGTSPRPRLAAPCAG
ncbi:MULTISPECIES: hypothetical protein [Nocardia]|uniref:hypothetical protein n=1 Tax=Nocardia TaxID=1817 RepID=UPI001CBE0DC4|nr:MULTISPECIES: hypothetical protein [Nocardia]